ncbi:tripartite tricarboxylate transporter substrate binding protein [Caenimonas sedimenti]|uniref:Tripartite tricarboxylate transporter substrate binding protein n=1 Tax=Caenimonas sedimenti TaxID=2596921 RepID=A0A562ZEE4_9BURK|nr:tripartite tricarboxylate transporter substrate binding protein [Caenimonas sedimenti]TWO65515.1 tripartite tricarboxylate transporter substrate binding protein [Caenimonas sedimenti]
MPFTRRTLLAATLALLPTLALAQGAYPNKPIRIVVPFPPGGSTDLLARRLGEKLATAMGQPVVVENKPGAGGTTGADFVAKSAPDGYTLLMGVTGSNAIAASLYPKLPYDTLKDFAPVSQLVSAPLVLSVNAGSPIKSVRDYVAAARVKPLSHGTPGNGTSMHLTAEMFDQAAGVRLMHVPYKGSAPAMNDLLGGTLDSMFGDFLVLLPQIKAGKVTPLAVTSARRHPMLPDVPTVAETGLPGLAQFEAASWQGLFAPAGVPREVLAKLNTEVVKAMESADIKEFFGSQGFIVGGTTPEQFKALIESEVPKWGRVVKAGNIKLD